MEPPAPMAYERTDSLRAADSRVGVVRARALAYEHTDSILLYSSTSSNSTKPPQDWEVVKATVVPAERRNDAAGSSFCSIQPRGEKSFSEWDALKSDPARSRPIIVQATARSKTVAPLQKTAGAPKGTLPSALRKPTIIARANNSTRIKSEGTCTTTDPESWNDEDYRKEDSLLYTPEPTAPSFLEETKSNARVNGVSFGNVEVREHSLRKELSVVDTVDGYEAKRKHAKQVPKDAPTKKSLTYETIRVQGMTTTPRPTQVAHHEPPPSSPSAPQDFLYSDFEAKFQTKRNKKGSKIGAFFGLFKRKFSKKNDSLVQI